MRNFMLVAVLICSGIVPPGFAQAPDEGQLIQVLNSNASVVAKETAARRLKQIGTSRCVAAVARLLPDEQLNQIACDVLETLPGDEAGRALQQALARTTGKSQATIIHALGERRHRPALPELRAALNAADELIASSAARAMGRIGGTDAVVALEYRLSTAADALRTALAEALLDCAGQFLMADNRRAAEAIYQRFNQASETEPIRVAATQDSSRRPIRGAPWNWGLRLSKATMLRARRRRCNGPRRLRIPTPRRLSQTCLPLPRRRCKSRCCACCNCAAILPPLP
jgi:hypothetical protein